MLLEPRNGECIVVLSKLRIKNLNAHGVVCKYPLRIVQREGNNSFSPPGTQPDDRRPLRKQFLRYSGTLLPISGRFLRILGTNGRPMGGIFPFFLHPQNGAKSEQLFGSIFGDSWQGSAGTAVPARGLLGPHCHDLGV